MKCLDIRKSDGYSLGLHVQQSEIPQEGLALHAKLSVRPIVFDLV